MYVFQLKKTTLTIVKYWMLNAQKRFVLYKTYDRTLLIFLICSLCVLKYSALCISPL